MNGHINLKKSNDIVWTYSKEHFSEIRRSNNPHQYLQVLDGIGAKLLDLDLDDDWKITGGANFSRHSSAIQHYEDYLSANNDVEFDENIFNPFQAWVNGGKYEELLKLVSEKLTEQVLSLISNLPFAAFFKGVVA
jgi:hypothetical protein